MTTTAVATGNAATKKVWARMWWIEAMRETYFNAQGFIGEDEDRNIIVRVRDLEKSKGDVYNYGHFRRLSGAGVSGDNAMEGSEEELLHYEDDVTINQYRNAVRLDGMLTEQRMAAENMRAAAKRQLKTWMAEKMDGDIFTAIGTSPTKAYYGGDATGTGDIESGDYLTLDLISKAKVYAYKATPRIYPVPIKGRKYYVLVVHPDCLYDLKRQDAEWAQAMREAEKRGADNPLFTGAAGVWDGVIIHEHEDVPSSAVWGSGTNLTGATNLFMGVQCGIIAEAKSGKSWVEKLFDYDNQTGFCVGNMYGVDKTVFNSADNALIAIRCYRTNIS